MGSREWGIGLRIADCGLRIADCGLRIADCGLRIDKTFNLNFKPAVKETHKSTVCNPQSLLPFCLCATIALFGSLFTGYIWSYQNSRSFFRAIKSQTELRGWIMKNRRLALAVVIVFVTLMTGLRRLAPSSSAAADCGLRIADCGLKDDSQSVKPRSAV